MPVFDGETITTLVMRGSTTLIEFNLGSNPISDSENLNELVKAKNESPDQDVWFDEILTTEIELSTIS